MSTKDNPLVTVFTLVYNTHRFAIEALESIKNQDYKNIEHIIIDDCSTDHSVALVEEWIEENRWKCTFIKNVKNIGITKNLNKILEIAKGEYICGISDDLWKRDYLQKQVAYFELLPINVAVVYSDYATIDEDSNIIKKSHSDKVKNLNGCDSKTQFRELLRGNFICAPTAIVRTSVILSVGGYDETYTAEDISMWLKLTNSGYLLRLSPYNTTFYRVRKESVTMQLRGRAVEEPLLFYSKFLGLNREFDRILAPRFYYWTKKLVINNYDYRLHWPLKSLLLNKDVKNLLLVLFCIYKAIQKHFE